MKPLCRLLLLLPCLVACSRTPDTSHLLGTYYLDLTSFRARLAAELPPGDTAKAQVEGLMVGVAGTVELRADGSVATAMKVPGLKIDETVPGTWVFQGDHVVITKKDLQNRDATQRARIGANELITEETAGGKTVAIRWVKR